MEKHRNLKSKLVDLPPEVLDSDKKDLVQSYINSIGIDIISPIHSLEQLTIVDEDDSD